MSNKRRLSGYSGFRLDIPHIRSVESAVTSDLDDLYRGVFTGLGRSYLIRGFKLKIPASAIQATSLEIDTADSVILHSTATESGTLLATPAATKIEVLNSANSNVLGAFQNNAINYISVDYRRVIDTSTVDQSAGWSQSQGIEVQRTTPIGRILVYKLIISTVAPTNEMPLYAVKIDSNGVVELIDPIAPYFFRLGSGGPNLNPSNSFSWGDQVNPQTNSRREWISPYFNATSAMSVAPGDASNAFELGDMSIKNLKDAWDAITSRLKEITNSQYWYTDSTMTASSLKLADVWFDSIGSIMTGSGSVVYNMILEGQPATYGKFQTPTNTQLAQNSDTYVQGHQSGAEAQLYLQNDSQLLINSLKGGFAYDEILQGRRRFKPDSSKFILDSVQDSAATGRLAMLRRNPFTVVTGTQITSYSVITQSFMGGDIAGYAKILATTVAPHGLQVGDIVAVSGLQATQGAPNGTAQVKTVPSATTFTFYHSTTPIAPYTVLGTAKVQLDNQTVLPVMPTFSVASWSYVGAAVSLIVPNHNFVAPVTANGDVTLNSNVIANIDTTGIKPGQSVTVGAFPAGTIVDSIGTNSVTVNSESIVTAAAQPIVFTEVITVIGLNSTTNAPNGVHSVTSIGPLAGQVNFTALPTPTGAATLNAGARITPDIFISPAASITGANPDDYNINEQKLYCLSEVQSHAFLGSIDLPAFNPASGQITLDAVVAVSKVINPVKASSITNPVSGVVQVTTAVAHGLNTIAGPISFTIFGDPSLSRFIREYSDVGITVISPTVFQITGTDFTAEPSYTNVGLNDKTFVKFSDNPYAGPIAWDQDMVVKGIVGDRRFKILATATAVTQSTDPNVSALANKFNTNGVTGTAYVQNGEVLYVKLDRNQQVSSGSSWVCAGGAGNITGSVPPTDLLGAPLKAGDFIKYADEDEGKWVRIAGIEGTNIVTNNFTVVSDDGQAPTLTQRPARNGVLVYQRALIDKVYVKKHALVEPSGDNYWLSVRRDGNNGQSKAYFRGLELELGEARQLGDNQSTNILNYIGSPSEGQINPNYTISVNDGENNYTTTFAVQSIDPATRMVTFDAAPPAGMQKGDKITGSNGSLHWNFTVVTPVSSRTAILDQDVSTLPITQTMTYKKENKNVDDTDNLTAAIRKEDRELGRIRTAMDRPIYDESFVNLKISTSGVGDIRSGSYIYKGPQTNPTALAWVLHGTATFVETIENAPVSMPGGHSSVGAGNCYVIPVLGTFNNGDAIFQNGASTGLTVQGTPNSSSIYGDQVGGGVEIVLPPNSRTQVFGTGFVKFGDHSFYKAATDVLRGEDLLMFVNGVTREANIDHDEVFGGPKSKIKLRTTVPSNDRIRLRIISAIGSVLATKAGDVTLQSAYNGGRVVNTAPGQPIVLNSPDVLNGVESLVNRGSILIEGGANASGGIFNETTDQQFVIGKEDDKPKEIWAGYDFVKTHSSHLGSALTRKTAAQVVTGILPVAITGSAVTVQDFTTVRMKATAVARRSDGPFGAASFEVEGTFFRHGGATQAAGQPVSYIFGADGDGQMYAVNFAIQGNDVVLVVYGNTGATVQWACAVEFQGVSI